MNVSTLWALRHLRSGNLAEVLLKIRDECGDVVVAPRIALVSDPAVIEHVLLGNWRNYRKSNALRRASRVLGNGLLTAEGGSWQRQRRMLAPYFHHAVIDQLSRSFAAVIDEMLSDWETAADRQQLVDASATFDRLALSNVVKTLFSADISVAEQDTVRNSLAGLLTFFGAK